MQSDNEALDDPVVYIIDGKRQWWRDRRIVMTFLIGLLVGLVLGMVVGHVLAILVKHTGAMEATIRANSLYKELVIRGDAAIAMLHQVTRQVESFGERKRVVLAEDLDHLKQNLRKFTRGVIVAPDGSEANGTDTDDVRT